MAIRSYIRRALAAFKLITIHDLDVLASEQETEELFQEAIENGRAPGNRCKIQFLGDGRAGKTSLCKKLRGEKFDPEEKPSHGIVTKMCKVNEVDAGTWKECTDDTSSDELTEATVSFLAKSILSKETLCDEGVAYTTKDVLLNIGAVFSLLLLACLVMLLSLLCGHDWNFCILVNLAAAIAVTTDNVDLWRVLSGIAFLPLCVKLLGPGAFWLNEVIEMTPFLPFICFLQWISLGFMHGFLCASGHRSTMIFAILCIWTPGKPLQLHDIFQIYLNNTSMRLMSVSLPGIIIGVTLQTACSKFLIQTNVRSYTPCHKILEHSLLIFVNSVTFIVVNFLHVHSIIVSLFLGIAFGMFISVGITQGRKVLSKVGNSLTFRVLAVLLACILAYQCNFQVVFMDLSITAVLGIFFRVVLVLQANLYQWLKIWKYQAPVQVISDKLFEAKAKGKKILEVSKKLSLWDFAGQEIYYNTHHAMLSAHAIYLLVFDLTRFIEPLTRLLEYQRIHFWLQSIYTHTNAPVILVGTHFDQVTDETIEATKHLLSSQLSYFSLINEFHLVPNVNTPFFKIDNSRYNETDDTTKLRIALQKVSDNIESISKDFPIKWRKFPKFVKEIRMKVELQLAPKRSLVMTVEELRKQMQDYDIKELKRMLIFFNDAGEIIYDSVDCVLRQFVVLDPQFIVDFMYFLTTSPQSDYQPHLSAYWSLLRLQGILHHILVTEFLKTTDNNFISVVLTLLEAKDLLCPMHTDKATSTESKLYIVPSMLPPSGRITTRNSEWNQKFYIDFGQFYPRVILSRLMSRCTSHSDLSFLIRSMHYDGGTFSLGDHFLFKLHLINPCPTQYLIEIAVRFIADSNPLDLLRHLCNIIETIRYRDFPRLRYRCGIICPHPPPHQGCLDNNMFHVIPFASHEKQFTNEERLVRLCSTRLVEYDSLQMIDGTHIKYEQEANSQTLPQTRNSIDLLNYIYSSDTESSRVSEPYDVFISCSPRDDGWVRENIIRVLGNPPHRVVICLNTYDSPSAPDMIVNAQVVKQTPVMLVVCSAYYRVDPTGRLRYERELAYRYNIKLIPIVLPNGSTSDDMYDVKPIHFPNGFQDTEGYDMLLQRINERA